MGVGDMNLGPMWRAPNPRATRKHSGLCGRRALDRVVLLWAMMCLLFACIARAEPITMTVLYDNTVCVPGTTADWGFSCLIRGIERPILYDTGNLSDVLLGNIRALQLDLGVVDDIFLSHDHYDHTGGLVKVLNVNSQVNVYLGAAFTTYWETIIRSLGATPIRVSGPVQLCNFVHSTGEVSGVPMEQSLIIEAVEGLVVITGCAHPGIVQILQRVQQVVPGANIYLVFGGFHLLSYTAPQIEQIIASFRALGVQNVGPTHCTGDLAIQLFQQAYGTHCLPMGTGREIQVSSLEEEVATFLTSFAAAVQGGGVTLTWQLSEATDASRLRLTASNDGRAWDVPIIATGTGSFTARDASPYLSGSGNVRYVLELRDENGGWSAIREELVALTGPPQLTVLLQPSPNPFNPRTVIRYSLQQAGQTTLAVYDLQGRRVRTLVDAAMPAGEQSVEWDGRDGRGVSAASGTYVIRLVTEQGTRTSKVTLAK